MKVIIIRDNDDNFSIYEYNKENMNALADHVLNYDARYGVLEDADILEDVVDNELVTAEDIEQAFFDAACSLIDNQICFANVRSDYVKTNNPFTK